jgi:cytochrome b pre-mRNA-processing protein 3
MIFRQLKGSTAAALYESAERQARSPALYSHMGAPDTVEGRFELLTLHVILLIERLRDLGRAALGQEVFDRHLSDLDGALREMGVGDLSVGRRMRDLGRVFYGRAAAFRQALDNVSDDIELENLVARTILAERACEPSSLARYARLCRTHLAAIDPAMSPTAADIWPPV